MSTLVSKKSWHSSEKRGKTSGVEFAVELERDLPELLSHPSQLQQVFVNLIAMPSTPTTESLTAPSVSAPGSLPETGAEVIIADTGSGIPRAIIGEKSSIPFSPPSLWGKGTGLGLSISYKIIKDLGGTIAVQSEVGKGTEFNIFLPFGSPKTVEEPKHDSQ